MCPKTLLLIRLNNVGSDFLVMNKHKVPIVLKLMLLILVSMYSDISCNTSHRLDVMGLFKVFHELH
jgi:hypothetical protein